MKIVCIMHADFETPGVIEDWAKQKQYHFDILKPYQGEALPSIQNYDMLILMGGPQSPLNTTDAPYLLDEIQYIKTAVAQQKPILGFCLGAQLIGEALGSKTERSPEKEVGVYPITLTSAGLVDPLLKGLPQTFPVIHWHNDMPGLTPNATILATSAGCPRQIIRYQPNIYGFQCHLEITLTGIETTIEATPGDLKPSKYTQTPEELLQQDYQSINEVMMIILDRFASLPKPA